MMIRVCCFVCTIALSGIAILPVCAQEGAGAADLSVVAQQELRMAGFELQAPVGDANEEDALIFTPIAPVAVDAEPVKLPADQQSK